MRHPEGFAPSVAEELAAIDKKRDSKMAEVHASEPHLPTLERAVGLAPEHVEVWLSMNAQSPHIDVKGVKDISGDMAAVIEAVTEDGWELCSDYPADNHARRQWLFSRLSGDREVFMLYLFVSAYLGDEHDCVIEETEEKRGPRKVFKILCPGSPEVQYRTQETS